MRQRHTFQINALNRDHGKVFIVTEVPAVRSERWLLRLLTLLANAGVQFGNGISETTLARLIEDGALTPDRIEIDKLEPLLREMMTCIQYAPDPDKPDKFRKLVDGDIEEGSTRLVLRREVLKIHAATFTHPTEALPIGIELVMH